MRKTKLQEIRDIAHAMKYSERGMSQIKMARQIGISEAYLSMVLRGDRPITAVIYDYFMERKKK